MRIRVTGTREECAAVVDVLRSEMEVRSAGSWRGWTRDDPNSLIGAVYVDAELPIGGVPRRS